MRVPVRSYRLLVKGASEMVLGRCSHVVTTDGSLVAMAEGDETHADVSRTIVAMARGGEGRRGVWREIVRMG